MADIKNTSAITILGPIPPLSVVQHILSKDKKKKKKANKLMYKKKNNKKKK